MGALLPLAGPVIGAISSGIASSKAASAASKTDKANQQINSQNLAARERERMDAIAQAEKMDAFLREVYGDQVADRAAQIDRMGNERAEYRGDLDRAREREDAGYTDALGNSTRFVPGQGWVTTKGKQSDKDVRREAREEADEDLFRNVRAEQIEWARDAADFTNEQRGNAREDREELRKQRGRTDEQFKNYQKGQANSDRQMEEVFRQIAEERPLVTAQMKSNFSQRGKERDQADAYMNQLKGLTEEDPIAFENILRERATTAINEGYDGTLSEAMRTGLRTGASNTDRIASEIGRSRAKDLQKAALDSMIQARGVTRKEYQDERANLAGLYNAFGDRSSKIDRVDQFQPVASQAPQFREQEGISATPDIRGPSLNITGRGAYGEVGPDASTVAAQTAIGARNLRSADRTTPFTPYTAPVNPNTGGQQALVTAFGSKGGTMDYRQPDNSDAMMWASFGNTANTLAGAFGNMMGKKPATSTYNTGGYNPLEKAFSF